MRDDLGDFVSLAVLAVGDCLGLTTTGAVFFTDLRAIWRAGRVAGGEGALEEATAFFLTRVFFWTGDGFLATGLFFLGVEATLGFFASGLARWGSLELMIYYFSSAFSSLFWTFRDVTCTQKCIVLICRTRRQFLSFCFCFFISFCSGLAIFFYKLCIFVKQVLY